MMLACAPTLLNLGLELGAAAGASNTPKILVCGDADFAYSSVLASELCKNDQEAMIWTSCYEQEDDLTVRYPDAKAVIDSLRRNPRVKELRYGVDCRALLDHYRENFDRIIFNLPQAPAVPGARNKIQRHRELLRDFCASAEEALAPHGQLWISLLAGQGGTSLDALQRQHGDTWMLQHAGASASLLVREAMHVETSAIGYTPTGRRSNQRLTPARLAPGLVVHVLSREGEPDEPAACGPIEWHFHNSFRSGAAVAEEEQKEYDGEEFLGWAHAALDASTAHALANAPVFLRSQPLSDGGGRAVTYRFIYSSSHIALSRERVQQVNSAACTAIAHATGLHWSLGYPVRPQRPVEP